VDTRKLFAEAVGTFILVGMGSLAILSTGMVAGTPLLVAVPLGFGLGLFAALAVAGSVSGGHFNPAVTLGAFLDKRIDAMGAVGYVVAQVVGAIVASAMILVISDQGHVAATRNLPGISEAGAFLVEVVLTAIFVAVILTVTKKAPEQAFLVIALTLVAVHVTGIPLSGASVNPARSLGPAIVALDFTSIWIYLTAPFIGAAVGWGVFRLISPED